MTDKAYNITSDSCNQIYEVAANSSYTPSIGDWVYLNTSGEAVKITAQTQRPFIVTDYSANGSGYICSVMNAGTFNSNETTDFYEGVPYYSDGDGTMSTVAVTTNAVGWIVGVALTTNKFLVDIVPYGES